VAPGKRRAGWGINCRNLYKLADFRIAFLAAASACRELSVSPDRGKTMHSLFTPVDTLETSTRLPSTQ
jgi:hypothetical protein